MKAAVYERYGAPEVVELREVTKPTPRNNEVLIKVYATTVTSGDWRVRSLTVPTGFRLMSRLAFGISGPRQKVLGSELAGVVEAVGSGVTKFKPGDEVFAFNGARMGCHAEYVCRAEGSAIALKPANLSFAEAAALSFGGTTALNFLRRGKVTRGEKILINGASGGVGTAAMQLAKHLGAEVTAVCSATNTDLVKSLGADHVIDYACKDFTDDGEIYDAIMDVVGTAPYARSKRALKDTGRLLLVLGGLGDMLKIPWIALTDSRRVVAGPAPERAEDLRYLADLASAGEFKPVIDRRYSLEQIVEAHRYVDTGRKRGNVVITLGESA